MHKWHVEAICTETPTYLNSKNVFAYFNCLLSFFSEKGLKREPRRQRNAQKTSKGAKEEEGEKLMDFLASDNIQSIIFA